MKDNVISDCFLCFVCKDCVIFNPFNRENDSDDEWAQYKEAHATSCRRRFEEVRDKIKPPASELLAANAAVSNSKRLVCNKCGYDAKGYKGNLKRHIAKCDGKKKQPLGTVHKCAFCDYSSLSAFNTKRHELNCKKKPETSAVPQNTVQIEPAKQEEANKTLLEVQKHSSALIDRGFEILKKLADLEDDDDDMETMLDTAEDELARMRKALASKDSLNAKVRADAEEQIAKANAETNKWKRKYQSNEMELRQLREYADTFGTLQFGLGGRVEKTVSETSSDEDSD